MKVLRPGLEPSIHQPDALEIVAVGQDVVQGEGDIFGERNTQEIGGGLEASERRAAQIHA